MKNTFYTIKNGILIELDFNKKDKRAQKAGYASAFKRWGFKRLAPTK